MNIILIGTGRMGRLLKECALDAGDAVVGEYGRANIAELAAAPAADVAIDFSGPEALPAVAAYVARTAPRSSRAPRATRPGKRPPLPPSANTLPSSGAPTTRSASPCSHARFAS